LLASSFRRITSTASLQRIGTRVKAGLPWLVAPYVVVHKSDRLARNVADDVSINLTLKAARSTLVSATENIDETPSGKLMHTILRGMNEFYSDNLALEVIKGSTQKAKAGGTIGRAPLGYLNVRRVENGRESRTVEVDPVRGPLMKWAFEAYASGDWTLRPLLDELTRRGLRSHGTRRTPEKPLELSHLHKLLRHPYFKGIVRYRGAECAGRHEPLVDEATWQRAKSYSPARTSRAKSTASIITTSRAVCIAAAAGAGWLSPSTATATARATRTSSAWGVIRSARTAP
jgi:site-specific DNA recombinase